MRPEIQNLEGRQLLSAFARETFGGAANDMVVYRPSNSTWYVATSFSGFNTSPQAPVGDTPDQYQWGTRGDIPIQNSDFFGNGHADLAVFRPSNGTWYIKDPVSDNTMTIQWGNNGDVPLAASDFFGNGHADLVVWRPSNGTWYVQDPITGQQLVKQWGAAGDVPVAHMNIDGDDRDDMVVYRPSNQTWYALTSTSNYTTNISDQWGAPGDIPIFSSSFYGIGSGYNDFAVFRPSNGTWYVKDPLSGKGEAVAWGTQGDVPLASSDFFGDGAADFAVYRPANGYWFIKDPLTGQSVTRQWGTPGDMPLANADFDGDGRADIAVFRPTDGSWHVLKSSSNFSSASAINVWWGAPGDEAIPGPDLPEPIADTNGSDQYTGYGNLPGVTYKSFVGDPLFASDGPSPLDVVQGMVGDCQTLAPLLGIAKDDPAKLRQSIVDFGDGTYAVDFRPFGVDQYVRVDATLPVDSNGNPIYAQLGHQNSLWVAVMEKAWTFARPTGGDWSTTNLGTYNMINGGGPAEILGQLGFSANMYSTNTESSSDLLAQTLSDFTSGELVALCTGSNVTSSSGLAGPHCYFVDVINYYWNGSTWVVNSLTLRNPWGGSNEFVTISASDFVANIVSETSAYV